MQGIIREIRNEEASGNLLLDRVKKESEEKLALTKKNLEEKYNQNIVSFSHEAEKVFVEKKSEIEKEMVSRLKKGEEARKIILEKAKSNLNKASDFIKKRIYGNS